MLCRKCRTAVDDGYRRCPYCGAALGTNKKIITVSLLGVVGAIGAIYALTASSPQESPPSQPANAVPAVISAAPTPTPAPDAAFAPPDESGAAFAMLQSKIYAFGDYFSSHFNPDELISRNGYLYSNVRKEYVSAVYLASAGYLPEDDANASVGLLYISPALLTSVGADVNPGGQLTLFMSYEIRGGVALVSVSGDKCVVTRENLKTVLDRYSYTPGQVTEYDFETGRDVIDFAVPDGISDVRYAAGDGQSAFVLWYDGVQGVYTGAALWKTADGWTFVQSGVTADETSRLSVNKNNPVFNLDVFPPYNFSNYNLNPSVPYEDILGGLGLTEDDVTFSAAADKFCCITTAAGGLYVCARQADGSWKIQAVNDTSSARAFMRSEHPAGIPPYFILPME